MENCATAPCGQRAIPPLSVLARLMASSFLHALKIHTQLGRDAARPNSITTEVMVPKVLMGINSTQD